MKPESELQAEETAFVNTCEKHSLLLAVLDRGRHQFELCVHDPDSGEVLARFGTYNKHTARPPCATTLEDIEVIAADGYDGPVVLTAATIQMIATTLREIAHGESGHKTEPLPNTSAGDTQDAKVADAALAAAVEESPYPKNIASPPKPRKD